MTRQAARDHRASRLPAVHHRRRRHRPRRRPARAQPDPALRRGRRARATTSRTSGPAPRSAATRAARCWCPSTSRSSASTPRASSSTSWGARHHRRAHRRRGGNLLDGRGDERDHPFILGATNRNVPSFQVASLAVLKRFTELGVQELSGHLLHRVSAAEYERADAWLERHRPHGRNRRRCAHGARRRHHRRRALCSTGSSSRFLDVWEDEAGLKTYGEAVADGDGSSSSPRAESSACRSTSGCDFASSAGCATRGRRRARWASMWPGTASCRARPRATTQSRAASSTPSPSRSRRRPSPTCSGWRRRPPTSTTPALRRGDPRGVSATRCSPTTSRRRSTGTPPA